MNKIIAFLLLVPYLGLADEVLTKAERIVALTILGEARGEGPIGMYAVACVIQTRAARRISPALPGGAPLKGTILTLFIATPAEICLRKKQFSPWNGVDPQGNYRLKKEHELFYLWESKHKMYARELARRLSDRRVKLMDITNGANHFCNINANPYWAKDKKPVIIIGNHKFYKL